MPTDRNNDPEEEDVADLPKREAMSLITDPTSLLGGLGGTTTGTAGTPTTDATQPPATDSGSIVPTMPTVNVPHVPVPAQNPGGTYTPDASASSETP